MTSVMVWAFTWTPYAVITMVGCFGDPMLITPLASIIPVVMGKYYGTSNCRVTRSAYAVLLNTSKFYLQLLVRCVIIVE